MLLHDQKLLELQRERTCLWRPGSSLIQLVIFVKSYAYVPYIFIYLQFIFLVYFASTGLARFYLAAILLFIVLVLLLLY